MELKSKGRQAVMGGTEVLIVPLWNWNVFTQQQLDAAGKSFNRTFMELK